SRQSAARSVTTPHPRDRTRSSCPPVVASRKVCVMNTVGAIILWVVCLVLVLLVVWIIASYNGLVRKRNQVDASWAQIDVQLKRRYDLIPNLVETVKGYAAHEKGTLDAVIQARNSAVAASNADPAARAQADNVVTQTLGRLFALAEAYPNLKANENFAALQGELTNTED